MMFKGRTVAAFVLLAVFATSIVTLTLVDSEVMDKFRVQRASASLQSKGLTQEELNKINAVFRLIESGYVSEIDRKAVTDGAISGMIAALNDPYSMYMNEETAKQFSDSLEGSFTGIGAEVALENGKVVVVAPIKGSPAEKAGIMPKDILLSVNGESLEGLTIHEAVEKIKGPKGTKAKLVIMRPGTAEPIELVLVRDEIQLETVHAEMLEGNIGKIEISQFSLNTADRFAEELERLEQEGMKGLVIDVRNDPGGILPIVVSIAEPFVPKGKPIVQIEDRHGNIEATYSRNPNGGKPYPVAVLINKGSASASEILAAALQENGQAVLVGEATFGKGTVQMNYQDELGDGSLVKMTVAKWLTPDKNWIHEKGVQPDIQISQPDYFRVSPLNKEKTLKYDMNDNDVKNAQMMLEALGYNPGRQDGYFGKQTEQAVRAFQKAEKLPVTGLLDKASAERLESKLIEHIRNPKNDRQLAAAVQHLLEKIASQADR
jgi:carboxyl-terminal processing protease